MEIGVSLSPATTGNAVDDVVAQAREAADAGLQAAWFGQRFDYDAIALAATVGREVPEIRVGTSAVPIYPRHPLLVAGQANTAQAATHGRFRLGLALGARSLIEPAFGVPYERPITRLRDFLIATRSVTVDGVVDYHGETLTAVTVRPAPLAGAQPPPPLLVAAMGPQALRVTGELADGTLPFLAGPRTLEQHIVPTITAAATNAGRPAPRIFAFLAAVVTDDIDAGKTAAAEHTAFYDGIPSYQRVVALEGHDRAADLAVVGDEQVLEDAVRRYRDAGATDIVVTETDLLGPESRSRAWKALGEIARSLG
ncbi:TIGR03564 family F420-dependent LLM class oxidoreductase [Rhodococcus triatomae]|uniref:F420-dependent oxidoreductase, MSMEG_4879 family n=1 Tax=Rhodococcus triatomae TaxID=300028 RepID=A0A1G8M7T0_9NOCA|nr:TIGR03564 family F420-dependent LLM class oxidoreductase [Rhodococcus triatomae]QNG18169.1 TIGR03564 family F420-dependent LLM class oxidoreductase [Rhodococcus triatomae]QNG22161.1 TIGR03564 family F420-dependent LLM class oxidoreductase [Rhodococcus triatomae]SDI63988.1 F420-dependent oxidoreductase, MSMEG_4879 family [Rhodococcus triatomae]